MRIHALPCLIFPAALALAAIVITGCGEQSVDSSRPDADGSTGSEPPGGAAGGAPSGELSIAGPPDGGGSSGIGCCATATVLARTKTATAAMRWTMNAPRR